MDEPRNKQDLQLEIESLREELQYQVQANDELLVYKQQLDAILNNAPVEVYLKDREGRYLRINKQFEKIFGVKSDDLVGLLPTDVHDPELGASTRNHDLFVLNSGKVEQREELARLVSDGQLHTLLTIKFPVFNDDGEVDGLGAIVTDITERKQMEETIRRAQKMDAVGQLTGGIAHDFNNILGIVLGNLELMKRVVSKDEKALSHLEAAYKGANRGKELTRKLLGFSRTTTGLAKIVSLNEFIEGMKDLIRKSPTVSIDTKILLEEDLWRVKIDPGDLEDVILNLSLNAFDSMPAGGEIVITTANQVIDENDVHSNPQAKSGEFVMLSVRDNGQGMTPEIRKKAMEPFFTTKEASKGTGLGLSMVYGFVKRSGGHIKIDSEPGVGTDIKLYLPRSYEEVIPEEELSLEVDLARGDETILIVDDEQALVDVAVSYLEDLGYKTVSVQNSSQALEVLKSNKAIDLLFTDVIMPGGIDGYELALAVHELYPALKILISSGFTKKHEGYVDVESKYYFSQAANLLNKPYDRYDLATAVRRVLDEEVKS
ncbi:MAG: ATP-binding protein [Gammaproteobacteria bacterium]|nr:ATP-binding protein [Gammaproteobacteria bacterium]